MIRLLLLHRDDPDAWAFMPQALARARLFATKYDADTDGDVLCEAIRNHFIAEDAKCRVRVLVAVRDGDVIGHLVMSVDTWCAKQIATIVQYEIDHGSRIPFADLRRAHDQALCWAESVGAVKARILARGSDPHGKARVRAFRRYGYEEERVSMAQPLHPSKETP